MAARLGIVLDVLSCGVVMARRITRRPWIGAINAQISPPHCVTAASQFVKGNDIAVRARVGGAWASNEGRA